MKQLFSRKLLDGKKLIGYGAGLSLLGTQASAPLSLEYLVDDTPGLAGKSVSALPVYHSDQLLKEKKEDILVIIYANSPRSIMSISRSLNRMGFIWGTHYIDCSFLHCESMNRLLNEKLNIELSYQSFFRIRMLSLYSVLNNISYIAGSSLYVELLEQLCSKISGGIAECGVYNGGNALISLLTSGVAVGRPYHLFDSFEGFPELSSCDAQSRKNEFKDAGFNDVRSLFNNFNNVFIHKGYFEKTFPSLEEQQFSMVYVDCDLYEGTLACCNYFYDRVPKGGCMVFHDYWVPEETLPHIEVFKGVNKAVNEFLGSEVSRLVVFPETTHAVIVKN